MSRRNFYFFSNYFCRRLIKIYPYKNIRKILNIKCEIGKNPPRTKMATNRAILSITRFEKNPILCFPKKPQALKCLSLTLYVLDNIKCADKTNRIRLKISKKKVKNFYASATHKKFIYPPRQKNLGTKKARKISALFDFSYLRL